MIPDSIRQFLSGPHTATAGTRDAELIPHVHKVFGWRIENDDDVTFFVPAFGASHLERDIADNAEIALTIADTVSAECYQLKGKVSSVGQPSAGDLDSFADYKHRLTRLLVDKLGYPEPVIELFVQPPVLHVRFRVREIYLQTPGPDAGKRLVPEEGR